MTGRPFPAFARDRLLGPLGLDRTTFDQRAISAEPDRAVGHNPAGTRVPTWIPIVPSGGLYTSAEEACRFVRFHLSCGEDLIGAEQLANLYEVPDPEPNHDLGYGLGIANLRLAGHPLRGHGGGGFGFCCNVLWSVERPVGVVILTNAAVGAPSTRVPESIFTDLLGEVTSVTVPPSNRQRFDGSFVGRVGAVDGSDLPYDGPQVRYRLDGDYLIRNDGFTFYRNEAPPLPAGLAPDGPWNRDYRVTVAGSTVARARLLRADDVAALELITDGVLLPLRRHRDGLYVSSTGEMLDLTGEAITYANIPLR